MAYNNKYQTAEEVEAEALDKGLHPIIIRAMELTLDIDDEFTSLASILTKDRLEFLDRNGIKVVSNVVTTSQGGNSHVWLRVEARFLSPGAKAAIQIAMGSDYKRELIALWRNEKNGCPLYLFETPEEAKKIMKWRRS